MYFIPISNIDIYNHEIKLAVRNLCCLRNEEIVEECIKAATVMYEHAASESFLVFKPLDVETNDITVCKWKLRLKILKTFMLLNYSMKSFLLANHLFHHQRCV